VLLDTGKIQQIPHCVQLYSQRHSPRIVLCMIPSVDAGNLSLRHKCRAASNWLTFCDEPLWERLQKMVVDELLYRAPCHG